VASNRIWRPCLHGCLDGPVCPFQSVGSVCELLAALIARSIECRARSLERARAGDGRSGLPAPHMLNKEEV
jgi:hypothetical protein